jgi:hypothetical protein
MTKHCKSGLINARVDSTFRTDRLGFGKGLANEPVFTQMEKPPKLLLFILSVETANASKTFKIGILK